MVVGEEDIRKCDGRGHEAKYGKKFKRVGEHDSVTGDSRFVLLMDNEHHDSYGVGMKRRGVLIEAEEAQDWLGRTLGSKERSVGMRGLKGRVCEWL